MSTFKFFEGKAEKQRVFTDFLDALDDYHLGGIPLPQLHMEVPATQLKAFTLNVMSNVFGRIPNYTLAFEPDGGRMRVIDGTIDDIINCRFGIPWCFTSLTIRRGGPTQQTFLEYVIINYNNVEQIAGRNLVFSAEDRIIIRYKLD